MRVCAYTVLSTTEKTTYRAAGGAVAGPKRFCLPTGARATHWLTVPKRHPAERGRRWRLQRSVQFEFEHAHAQGSC